MKLGNFWADEFFAEDFWAPGFWADQFTAPPIPTPAGIKARPTQPFALVEIDMPFCERTYGIAPCTAKLAGTLTANIEGVVITQTGPGVSVYSVTVETDINHNLVAGQYVDISGVVATGDYDINGEKQVSFIVDATHFRIPYPHPPLQPPTGSYTSGGTFVASIFGATGTRKCFNTIRTCQDRPNFLAETKTLRFCEPTDDIIFTKESQPVIAIPSVNSISVTPSMLKPGIDIGQRESVKVSFKDHQDSDTGLDKYLDERDYDPVTHGTFWGRLRARNRSLEGNALRIIRGEIGDDLTEADVYHYVIDGITGQGENVSVSAKDFLILTDRKKAQCPVISNGVLSAELTEGAGTLTVLPVGVGDAEYPLSGKIAIGGEEICAFTRVGDVFTLTERGASGTEPAEHDEGDIVQLVKIYPPQPPADIIYNLFTEFCPEFDPAWINAAEWEVEVDQYIGRLYTAEIAEPTSVVTLINELIEQVGLVLWADPLVNQVRLRSLRPVSSGSKTYNEDQVMPGLRVQEQTQLRVSSVWTYYGLRNPLEPIDEPRNYKSGIASNDSKALQDYPHPAIKKVFSRWIASNNRAAAARLNGVLLARYRDAPRKFEFDLYSTVDEIPSLGGGAQLNSWMLQDDTGANEDVPVQITSLEVRTDSFRVDAQEAIFVEQGDLETVKLIFIDDVAVDVNLRDLYDQTYLPPVSGDHIRCLIGSTGLVGASSTSIPAFDVGDWPAGVTLELVVNPGGNIAGKGGKGGNVPITLGGATAGGTAFKTRHPISVTNQGRIRSGGGGGSNGASINIGQDPEVEFKGGGGGGGAGYRPGEGGSLGGQDGRQNHGGEGGTYVHNIASVGGTGGAPGEAGLPGNSGLAGGAAGAAVDGESFVTYLEEGTIVGGRIN